MSKGKFLIVEDEFVVAENLRAELESMGYDIVGMAFSGNEALELARQKRPDLVLMDIKLREGMDGIETAIHLRQEMDVPSFFLTAFSNESFLERAKLAEPLGYMVKPFERNGLRAGLEMAHYKARAETLLKESESRFRSMFENSPVAYLALDEHNCCLDLNFEFCKLLGYNRDEIIGRNFLEFCTPDKWHMYSEEFATLKDSGRLEAELELVRKDNILLTIVLQGRIQPDIEGNTLKIHCILHNISERKRIEEERRKIAEELWKQNALQQTLLAAIPAYVYIKNKNSVYMVGNKKFSELSGIPENEIAGKTDYDFFSETDADSFRRNDAEIFASGEARLNYEMKGKNAEGNTIWFSTSKSPFYSYSGQIAGLVGICINITEQKRLEEERQQFEHRIQQAQKAESLGRMAGAVAHHFNNMLSVVIGNLELVTMDLPHESKSNTYISQAMKASDKAAEMSRLMLTYLGQTIAKKERLDFAKIVGETQSLLSASVPGNVHVRTEVSTQGVMIDADRVHIQQILNNLFSNAVEAIGEKEGRITVAVEIGTVEKIQKSKIFPVDWQPKPRNYVCLSVADTGPGLDAATMEKIFDPFYTTKFTGRGMGLPVVLGLMQAYKGGATVYNTDGAGAVFRVYFPIAERDELSCEKEALLSPQIKGGGLVLVVDDEPLVRDMARTMLERILGYTVIVAGDGREAIDIFQSQKDEFRFVLLDLSMPGMNGWQTLTAIREIQLGIPVILASGFDEAQVMQGKHPELPQAFLHKPYQLSELKVAISLAEAHQG
jgi:two-component system, cell cycle sensor histidine kinase and response regulator CckA